MGKSYFNMNKKKSEKNKYPVMQNYNKLPPKLFKI